MNRQRKQNTTPAIIAHYVTNGIGWIGILLLGAAQEVNMP